MSKSSHEMKIWADYEITHYSSSVKQWEIRRVAKSYAHKLSQTETQRYAFTHKSCIWLCGFQEKNSSWNFQISKKICQEVFLQTITYWHFQSLEDFSREPPLCWENCSPPSIEENLNFGVSNHWTSLCAPEPVESIINHRVLDGSMVCLGW